MKRRVQVAAFSLICCCTLFAPKQTALQQSARVASAIDDLALRQADTRATDWISHGRTYSETRYSPLNRMNAANAKDLGVAWSFDIETNRGVEATPLVIDGVIYTTGSWSTVFAIDARTGKQLWKFDPHVPREFGQKACCDVVNRGVAVYKGRVYVGTLDGRLVALDAETGRVIWQVTTVDQTQPYTITGAPRVVKGKVIIGNGGAEFGVRGYVSAYDAQTGKMSWRFYTVPGDPSKGFESSALEVAAKTWNGEWWKYGGGGTVWDSMAYDPDLDLLYVGTGNGSTWNRNIRSPAGGDNLYLSSIVALKPDSGELVWYYQTTPGDSWDFTATQHMILADLQIGGRLRKVIMQAPKNGFFYVLDRATGELLSAEPYVKISWAKGVDKTTGRPIENPGVRYEKGLVLMKPGPLGGHNWQPMSFNPQTGLVYIPAQDFVSAYVPDPRFVYRSGAWNLGVDMTILKTPQTGSPPGHLLAWDPVAQKERWRVQYNSMWNSGTLTTAGNLVFQGTADGRFVAYSADRGEKLWEFRVGVGVMGSPIAYELDGVEYVAVSTGWGGAFALLGGNALEDKSVMNAGRLIVFALGGKGSLIPIPRRPAGESTAIESTAPASKVEQGANLFAQWCAVCHGVAAAGGGGVIADLRLSNRSVFDSYQEIVLNGAYSGRGMPSLKKWLTPDDVEAIRVYVLRRRSEVLNSR